MPAARAARADAAMLEAEKLDVLQIWNAATTTDFDRKGLLRMLVRSVIVDELGREGLRWRSCF